MLKSANIIHIEIGQVPDFDLSDPKRLASEVRAVVEESARALGLEGKIKVDFSTNFAYLKINGQRCDYSTQILKQVDNYRSYLSKEQLPADPTKEQLIVQGILFKQAAALLTDQHLDDFLSTYSIQVKTAEEKAAWRILLQDLLQRHIGIKHQKKIKAIIASHTEREQIDFSALTANLIDQLSDPQLKIYLSKSYLQSITEGHTTSAKEGMFGMMRDGLYYELGMKFPDFAMVFHEEPEQVFHFQINDQVSLPFVGIKADQVLLGDTVERLAKLGVNGVAMVNPGNGNNNTLVSREEMTKLSENQVFDWDALGYFILCFSQLLRVESATFVTASFTAQQLAKLKSVFSRNIELLSNQYPTEFITEVLRMLVAEGVSIRNLKKIANDLLQCDFIQADERNRILFDDRIAIEAGVAIPVKNSPPYALQYVRSRMKEYLSHKYTRGQGTLVVYLLDMQSVEATIHEEITKGVFPSPMFYNQMMKAIEEQVANHKNTAQLPAILTTSGLRPHVRQLVKYKFPHLPVLAYQELSPSMKIQPIARIGF